MPPTTAQQVRPPSALVQGPPLRVLVVDDNQTNRTILEEQLAPWGLSVTSVGDGPAALDQLRLAIVRREPFAAALLDRHMPGMDGLTLARTISADPALASTPMVLLTSLGEEDRRDVQAAGFQHVLTKPVRQSQLLTMLGTILGVPVSASIRVPWPPIRRPVGPPSSQFQSTVRGSWLPKTPPSIRWSRAGCWSGSAATSTW